MSVIFNSETLRYVASFLLFASVAVVATSVTTFVRHRIRLNERLKGSGSSMPLREAAAPVHRVSLDDGLLSRFEDLVTPTDEVELSNIRKRLVRAGYRWHSAVRVYSALRAAFAVGFSLIAAILATTFSTLFPLPALMGAVVGLAIIGFFLPTLWVERQIQRRCEEAELGFPDALDMLLVCIEGGNSIDQACRRVAREMSVVQKVLSEEFAVINDELWAGKQRTQVFADFADRLKVQDITAFATVLKQSDEYGVSVADTLRVYASEMRNKRVMKAEEKANLMPVKLAMGSILFTVPPTMIIMAGPSLIAMLRAFSTTLGH